VPNVISLFGRTFKVHPRLSSPQIIPLNSIKFHTGYLPTFCRVGSMFNSTE